MLGIQKEDSKLVPIAEKFNFGEKLRWFKVVKFSFFDDFDYHLGEVVDIAYHVQIRHKVAYSRA